MVPEEELFREYRQTSTEFFGRWHNGFHNFGGKSDSVFRGHVMTPAFMPVLNGGTMGVQWGHDIYK